MKFKFIRILDKGIITTKGGIRGPIMTPHREDISLIFAHIMKGYNVEELLDNGSFIKLDMSNFDKDNNVAVEQSNPVFAKFERRTASKPVYTKSQEEVEIATQEVEEEPVLAEAKELDVPEEQIEEVRNNIKNKNKNKHHNSDKLQRR